MCIAKPTVFWKSEMQQGQFSLARAFNPAYCYRGLPVAVCSIAPVTCIQFVANNAVLRSVGISSESTASDRQRLAAGVLSGFASATAQSPMQLVEINQQNHGGGMVATARRVVEARGFSGLYKGYSMTACREGIFVTSYMAAAPLLRQKLQEKYPDVSDGAAMAGSSIVAGGLGSALSHPFDTLKTRLQGGIFPSGLYSAPAQDNNLLVKIAQMRNSGTLLPQLYAGFVPRFFRIVSCTFIYGSLKESFEGILIKQRLRFQDSGIQAQLKQPAAMSPLRGEEQVAS
jgi:hypothetical protein